METIQFLNVFKPFNKTKTRRSTHAEAGCHNGMPFTPSRYTLLSLVARKAPGRGKNKHNLNVFFRLECVNRVTGPLDTGATFPLSLFLPLPPSSYRGYSVIILQYHTQTRRDIATISRCNNYAARARTRKRARRMTPSELPCSIHIQNIDVNTLHLPSHSRLVEPASVRATIPTRIPTTVSRSTGAPRPGIP